MSLTVGETKNTETSWLHESESTNGLRFQTISKICTLICHCRPSYHCNKRKVLRAYFDWIRLLNS